MKEEQSNHILEQNIIFMMNLNGWELEWTGESFEHYDAKGKTPKGFDCIVELKVRNSYYHTKILERYKYIQLMAEPNCIKFYYVFDKEGNYLYYLDELKLPKIEHMNLQATTYFKNNSTINKDCYFLLESQASVINKYYK